MPRLSVTQSRAIFGNPSPPLQVSEYQFDGFDDDLRRLAETPWDKIKDEDLWYYLHDLILCETRGRSVCLPVPGLPQLLVSQSAAQPELLRRRRRIPLCPVTGPNPG